MALHWDRVDQSLLDPQFVGDLNDTLEAEPVDWWVTHGFRSREEQTRLYRLFQAGGPRAAPPGLSPHEYGLAVDLALDGNTVKARLQPDYDESDPAWVILRELVDASPRLHGGWVFGDGDHIERVNWKQHLK